MFYIINRSTGHVASEYMDKAAALEEAARIIASNNQPYAILEVDDGPEYANHFQIYRRVVASFGYGPCFSGVPQQNPPILFQPARDADSDD